MCDHLNICIRACEGEDVAEVPKETPYQASYSRMRLSIHTLCTSKPLDLFMAVLIVISILIMEHYQQPLVNMRTHAQYNHWPHSENECYCGVSVCVLVFSTLRG